MGDTIDRTLAEEAIDQDQIRAAVREGIAEDKCSITTFAKAAGLSDKTFNAWLNDTYKGNTEAIARSAKVYLASRAARMKTRLAMPRRTSFVETPSATAFMSLFAQAQFAPDMVTLVGVPGVGKTTTALEYQRRHPNVYLLTAEPIMKGPYALLESLCDVMGVREASPLRRPRVIANHLKGRTALIIIDEAQHVGLTALDQLRALHDDPEVQAGLALIGNPDVRNRMKDGGKGGAFAQLDSRFGMHLSRQKPLASDVIALLDAEQIMGTEERALLRAVAASPGALRKMNRVLRVARMIATGQEDPEVTADHITQAHTQLTGNDVIAGAR